MNPEQIAGPEHFQGGVGESLVHLEVVCPILRLMASILWEIVKQRPQSLVTKARVESVDLGFG